MRSKTLLKITVVVMLVAICMVMLCACNNDDDITTEQPITTGQAFTEVVEKLMRAYDIDYNNQFHIDLDSDIRVQDSQGVDHKMDFGILMNLNSGESGSNDNNNFAIDLKAENGNTLFGIYADGEYLYFKGGEKNYKVNNFRIYDLMKGKADSSGNSRSISILDVTELLGGILFESVEVKGGRYTFYYDLSQILDTVIPMLESVIGEGTTDAFASALGYQDWNDLHNAIGEVHGEVSVNFLGDRVIGANIESDTEHADFSIDVTNIDIASGLASDAVSDRLPEGYENFQETKLMAFVAKGTIGLEGADGIIAQYNWELISNLDPLELAINRGDFSMDEDDMVHFTLYNNMSDNLSAYNDSKVKPTDGVILEVAYSPKEFNTNNVLITANLKALIPKTLLKEFNIPNMVTQYMPEYYGANLNPEIFSHLTFVGEQTPINEGHTPAAYSQSRAIGIKDILSYIKLFKGGLEIDRDFADKALGENAGIIKHFLDVEGANSETLRVKIDYFNFADPIVEDYKAKEHFLYVADKQNAVVKDFGNALGYTPAKEILPKGENGYISFTTADKRRVNYDNSHQISIYEANSIVGGTMNYDYIDYYGNKKTDIAVKILGVSGLDYTKIGEEQTINLITNIPDGNNLLTLMSAFNLPVEIPAGVFKTKIILTDEASSEFKLNQQKTYRVGDVYNSSATAATLNIEYSDGETQSYNALPINSDVALYKDGNASKFAQAGEYNLTYRVAGREFVRKITVEEPDSYELQFDVGVIGVKGESAIKNYGKLLIKYADDVREVAITRDNIVFPQGAVVDEKFAVAGNYTIEVDVLDRVGKFEVSVLPMRSTYKADINGDKVTLTNGNVGDIGSDNVRFEVDIKAYDSDGNMTTISDITINKVAVGTFTDNLGLILTDKKVYTLGYDIADAKKAEISFKIIADDGTVVSVAKAEI